MISLYLVSERTGSFLNWVERRVFEIRVTGAAQLILSGLVNQYRKEPFRIEVGDLE
jgi:hypothetical protein